MSGIFVAMYDGPYGTEGDAMSTVAEMYLPVAVMTIVGIGFPVGSFIATRFLRPTPKGSDPLGDADINFHFQYYWYAIVFLVFDIAFMFLAFGGVMAIQKGSGQLPDEGSIISALLTMTIFIILMGLGVWHVFRKRGRIYI